MNNAPAASSKQIDYLLSLVSQANRRNVPITSRSTTKAISAARFGGLSKSEASGAIDDLQTALKEA